MHGTKPPVLNMSSWHGAQLSNGYYFMVWYLFKHRDNFTLISVIKPVA